VHSSVPIFRASSTPYERGPGFMPGPPSERAREALSAIGRPPTVRNTMLMFSRDFPFRRRTLPRISPVRATGRRIRQTNRGRGVQESQPWNLGFSRMKKILPVQLYYMILRRDGNPTHQTTTTTTTTAVLHLLEHRGRSSGIILRRGNTWSKIKHRPMRPSLHQDQKSCWLRFAVL